LQDHDQKFFFNIPYGSWVMAGWKLCH